uniref:Uncharacterized protein At1g76660 n=1 Tax=Anthurium amnicola TaxID=1678845 RepID=A0A1D1XCF1_9ARAE
MRGLHNSMETVNAAAAAIVSAESRVQQVTSPRRRWGGCFSMYWCFGSQRHDKRISHAAFVPEPTLPGSAPVSSEGQTSSPVPVLPFVAPPSSPASSFLQSEPPSAIPSPAGPLSLTALSANVYSPGGPASIFAIGPYANETQLVSPPVFSTFTTEPSTAPLTPPPESVQLTTPSSPEVPFARLLTSSLDPNNKKCEVYEFQSYLLYPGSPIGHLISPSSVCSGTTSPFPEHEINTSGDNSFTAFPTCDPPKILSAEGLAIRKLAPRHTSGHGGSLLDGQISAAKSVGDSDSRCPNSETVIEHRLSFELTVEEVARCLAKEPTIYPGRVASEPLLEAASPISGTDQLPDKVPSPDGYRVDETYHDLPEKLPHSASRGTSREFKFDNTDGTYGQPTVGSDWWANEKVVSTESGHRENWTFFPIVQSGAS